MASDPGLVVGSDTSRCVELSAGTSTLAMLRFTIEDTLTD